MMLAQGSIHTMLLNHHAPFFPSCKRSLASEQQLRTAAGALANRASELYVLRQ